MNSSATPTKFSKFNVEISAFAAYLKNENNLKLVTHNQNRSPGGIVSRKFRKLNVEICAF